jgi:hypothetical protein
MEIIERKKKPPEGPDEIITVRVNRRVKRDTHGGRHGYYQLEEYEEIYVTGTTLGKVYDIVMQALKEEK